MNPIDTVYDIIDCSNLSGQWTEVKTQDAVLSV